MTEEQLTAVREFAVTRLGDGSGNGPFRPEPVFKVFNVDFVVHPEAALRVLESSLSTNSSIDVAMSILLCQHFGALSEAATPILCQLLAAEFHDSHEEIARVLQGLRDPRSIDALYAACFLDLPYFYDDGDAMARKCTWALHDIGTEESIEKLRSLSGLARPAVAEYARKRLTS